jgi:hypothetical protein
MTQPKTPDEFDCFLDSLVYDREEFKSALEQAGIIMVPEEPTDEMLEAKVEQLTQERDDLARELGAVYAPNGPELRALALLRRAEAAEAERDAWRGCVIIDAKMDGPKFRGFNRQEGQRVFDKWWTRAEQQASDESPGNTET